MIIINVVSILGSQNCIVYAYLAQVQLSVSLQCSIDIDIGSIYASSSGIDSLTQEWHRPWFKADSSNSTSDISFTACLPQTSRCQWEWSNAHTNVLVLLLFLHLCSGCCDSAGLLFACTHDCAYTCAEASLLSTSSSLLNLNFVQSCIRHESAFVQLLLCTDCTLVVVHFLDGMWYLVLSGSTVPLTIQFMVAYLLL